MPTGRNPHEPADLDRILSALSHEFRTPLTSIRSFAEILLDSPGEDEETRREFLTIIHDEAVRLSRLVNNLLDLGRLEAGRMECEFQVGRLADSVRAAVRTVATLAADREVMIRVQGDETVPPLAFDPDRVIQVLVNLLGNAVKFSPRGETVHVMLTAYDGGVRVTVRDRGPGVAAEHRKRVFERFWRGDHVPERGTGLGLSIASEIVAAHGGRIWVDAAPDGGSDFVFELPDREGSGIREIEEARIGNG